MGVEVPIVDVFVCVCVDVDVLPPDVVGTTIPSEPELICAIATELPKNMDKPRPLKNRNLRVCERINHPLLGISLGVGKLSHASNCI